MAKFSLISGKQKAGSYKVDWDATGFANGVYYYKIEAVDPLPSSGHRFVESKKLLLIK